MMTLISLAITVPFVFSLAVTFGFPGATLLEVGHSEPIRIKAKPLVPPNDGITDESADRARHGERG